MQQGVYRRGVCGCVGMWVHNSQLWHCHDTSCNACANVIFFPRSTTCLCSICAFHGAGDTRYSAKCRGMLRVAAYSCRSAGRAHLS